MRRRRRRRRCGQGGRSGGADGCGGRGPPCGAGRGVRARGRSVLGVLGNVRPVADERLRRSRHVDHLRAHGHRRRVLPVPHCSARLARPRGGAARLALARAHRGLRRVRRAAYAAQLPQRYRLHVCRGWHHHRAGGARDHHAVRVSAHAAPAARSGGGGPRVRARRHGGHRHARRSEQPRHTRRGLGLGPRVGRGAVVLHAHARAGAGEMGLDARDGPGHAVRGIGGVACRAAVDDGRAAFRRRSGRARGHRAGGNAGRLHALPAGGRRCGSGESEPSVLRRAGVGHGARARMAARPRIRMGRGRLRPHRGHDLPRHRARAEARRRTRRGGARRWAGLGERSDPRRPAAIRRPRVGSRLLREPSRRARGLRPRVGVARRRARDVRLARYRRGAQQEVPFGAPPYAQHQERHDARGGGRAGPSHRGVRRVVRARQELCARHRRGVADRHARRPSALRRVALGGGGPARAAPRRGHVHPRQSRPDRAGRRAREHPCRRLPGERAHAKAAREARLRTVRRDRGQRRAWP